MQEIEDYYSHGTNSWLAITISSLLGLGFFLKCYSLSRYGIECAHISECDVMQKLTPFGELCATIL